MIKVYRGLEMVVCCNYYIVLFAARLWNHNEHYGTARSNRGEGEGSRRSHFEISNVIAIRGGLCHPTGQLPANGIYEASSVLSV